MSEDKPRVIVIGLDGATWDLIKPWAKGGELPAFRRLMDEGAWGILESTIPPLSPSAWVSIYTGCKPSKHGIFGFLKRKENSYFYRPISSKDIKKWDSGSIFFNAFSLIVGSLYILKFLYIGIDRKKSSSIRLISGWILARKA